MSSPIEMRLNDEKLEELSQGGPQHGPELGKLIVADIKEFEDWLSASLDGPLGGALAKAEKAILQTYAYWKLTKGRRLNELPRVKLQAETPMVFAEAAAQK